MNGPGGDGHGADPNGVGGAGGNPGGGADGSGPLGGNDSERTPPPPPPRRDPAPQPAPHQPASAPSHAHGGGHEQSWSESPYMGKYEEWASTKPYKRKVRPNDTVKHQMETLLDSDSRYITQARQSGREFAASRGLLNSSIAAGAAERSAIEAALPIAQQDAQTYFTQGITNQNAENQFRFAMKQAGLEAFVQSDMLSRQLAHDWDVTMAELEFQYEELATQFAGSQLAAVATIAGNGGSPEEAYNIVYGGAGETAGYGKTTYQQVQQYADTFNSPQYSRQRASSANNYRRLYDEQYGVTA